MGPVIALVGAESTGKTTLAHTLALELRALGRPAARVAEYLREFCDTQGRTPRPEEQGPIADEQWRRIEAAAQDGSIVLADTTPLMIAVYSEFVFGDRSLYAQAIERQHRCAHTLLTGLDLAWQPDGLQRDGAQVRGPVDGLIRNALASAALPYSVVYGEGPARKAAALAALRPLLKLPPAPATNDGDGDGVRLRARCRECLLPECEHLASRLAAKTRPP
ncbi:AAA family ATPase [Methylibium sp.]|uniref:AAA family ATPase n=1 Tax=Methylibium sp. TaxID=2067992 RepID=UPI003D0E8D27